MMCILHLANVNMDAVGSLYRELMILGFLEQILMMFK
jgi:hypothetical protein